VALLNASRHPEVPLPLLARLKPVGRLVMPLGHPGGVQALTY